MSNVTELQARLAKAKPATKAAAPKAAAPKAGTKPADKPLAKPATGGPRESAPAAKPATKTPTVTDPNRFATRKQRGFIAKLSGTDYYAGSDLSRGAASNIIDALLKGQSATLPDGTPLTKAA